MILIAVLFINLFLYPLVLTITGIIGCFLTAKIVQHIAAEITNTDVIKITVKFAVGVAISSIFFGVTQLFLGLGRNPLIIGIFMTIGFIILGTSFGGIVAKFIFQRLEEISTSTNQMHMEEETVFESQGIKITKKRAILGGKTYAISNITSVSKIKKDDAGCLVPVLISAGPLLLLMSINGFTEWDFAKGMVYLALGGLLFFGGFFIHRTQKTKSTFIVQIGSTSGKANVLQSQDETYIQNIVEAINNAIVLNSGRL